MLRLRHTPSGSGCFYVGRSPGLQLRRRYLHRCVSFPAIASGIYASSLLTVAGAAAFQSSDTIRRKTECIPSSPVLEQEPTSICNGPCNVACQEKGISMVDENQRHNQKMRKIKTARDKMMQSKTDEKGLIIVCLLYTSPSPRDS